MLDKLLEDRVSLPVACAIIIFVAAVMIFLNYKVYRKNNPKPFVMPIVSVQQSPE